MDGSLSFYLDTNPKGGAKTRRDLCHLFYEQRRTHPFFEKKRAPLNEGLADDAYEVMAQDLVTAFGFSRERIDQFFLRDRFLNSGKADLARRLATSPCYISIGGLKRSEDRIEIFPYSAILPENSPDIPSSYARVCVPNVGTLAPLFTPSVTHDRPAWKEVCSAYNGIDTMQPIDPEGDLFCLATPEGYMEPHVHGIHDIKKRTALLNYIDVCRLFFMSHLSLGEKANFSLSVEKKSRPDLFKMLETMRGGQLEYRGHSPVAKAFSTSQRKSPETRHPAGLPRQHAR